MIKNINLKYNKQAKLHLTEDCGDYLLTAHNEKKDLVGVCKFGIVRIYSKQLDDNARKLYAKRHRISLDKAPFEKNMRVGGDKDKFTIKDDILTDSKGNEYKYRKTMCAFGNIDILDERYYKVGLGSAMFAEVERIALENDCEYIEAFYYPNGLFQFGTHDFYVRNGFKFTMKGNQTYAIKDLTSLKKEPSNKNVDV